MFVNYDLLHRSANFYKSKSFLRIETPWMVTEYIDSITRPDNAIPYVVPSKNKNLIASGEQGFLYLYLKRYLPYGKFQTITPCFRNDPYDLTHSKNFMKNELIQTQIVSHAELEKTVETAYSFFKSLFKANLEVVETEEGFDIEFCGVELGSYGIRHCEFISWIYGTGLAEPRTSTLLDKYGISY